MDLRQLRHADALAETLSFTKAAEKLGLTQSALSQSIKALEDEYQVRLFDRTRGGVHVTAIGRRFVDQARALLREGSALETMVRDEARGESVDIAIGMAALPTKVFLTPLLKGLLDTPQLHIEVTVGGPPELLAMLIDEKIEFCVCAALSMPANAPVTGIILGSYTFAALVRSGHPLAARDRVTAEEMRRYPIMLSSRRNVASSGYPAITSDLIPERPAIVAENYDALLEVALASDAVWITSLLAVTRELADGTLKTLRVGEPTDPPLVELTAFHLRRRRVSPTASRIIERLKTMLCEPADLDDLNRA